MIAEVFLPSFCGIGRSATLGNAPSPRMLAHLIHDGHLFGLADVA
jgi:hypothetical protein